MPARRITVRRSPIHGRGVFATTGLPAGEVVIDYGGDVVSWEQASARYVGSDAQPGHTFFFDIGDGLVIDGGRRGNSARFINHSCEPNVEAAVDGRRVVITARRDIAAGEELLLDYQLQVDDDADEDERAAYACACGAPSCRETMLAAS